MTMSTLPDHTGPSEVDREPLPACLHRPTSAGQSMCVCEDNRMQLELLVSLLTRHVGRLERRLYQGEPRLLDLAPDLADRECTDCDWVDERLGGAPTVRVLALACHLHV
jgi:hypothetical protein